MPIGIASETSGSFWSESLADASGWFESTLHHKATTVPPTPEPKFQQPRFLVVTGLILAAACLRLITMPTDWQNFQPVGAIALFGGACFLSRRLAFIVPLAAMLLSDVLLYAGRYDYLAEHGWKSALFVYLSFGLIIGLGLLLRERRSWATVLAGSLAATVTFYLVSNFGWWLLYDLPAGRSLAQTYINAIPFIRGTFAGDLFYNGVLFGAFAMAESRIAALKPAHA